MRASVNCLPCIIGQAILAVKKSGRNKIRQKQAFSDLITRLPSLDFERAPGEIAYDCLTRVAKSIGVKDSFSKDKQIQNKKLLRLEPFIRHLITKSSDRLFTTLNLALAGNLIDSLLLKDKVLNIRPELSRILKKRLRINHYALFVKALTRARTILYILDNAGEIVFDKILVEELIKRGKRVTCVVRKAPVLNDVLIQDARTVGLDRLCRIINPGVGAVGLPLHLSSAGFQRRFKKADLVISKGQANFETLEGTRKDNLFFLFIIKCDTVAEYLGLKTGDLLFLKNQVASS